ALRMRLEQSRMARKRKGASGSVSNQVGMRAVRSLSCEPKAVTDGLLQLSPSRRASRNIEERVRSKSWEKPSFPAANFFSTRFVKQLVSPSRRSAYKLAEKMSPALTRKRRSALPQPLILFLFT